MARSARWAAAQCTVPTGMSSTPATSAGSMPTRNDRTTTARCSTESRRKPRRRAGRGRRRSRATGPRRAPSRPKARAHWEGIVLDAPPHSRRSRPAGTTRPRTPRVTEAGRVPPDMDHRLRDRVLRQGAIAQDADGHPGQALTHRGHEGRECDLVTALSLDHQLRIHAPPASAHRPARCVSQGMVQRPPLRFHLRCGATDPRVGRGRRRARARRPVRRPDIRVGLQVSPVSRLMCRTCRDSRQWWAVRDSNPRHPRCKRGALTGLS